MHLALEKAQIMFKLARNGNWGASYDRTEHFKRFQNIQMIIKELKKQNWIITHEKPKFLGISLNQTYKKEIITFVEQQLPHLTGGIH
ncbi:MAG TPA: hypothetical protein VJB87_02155 [Candidatus Nanoarchaeia archaeon]|nr:hypothetical protein [Candidatus Nanoarchaeia archaeon]